MKLLVGIMLTLSLVLAASGTVHAQDPPENHEAIYEALHDYFSGETTLEEAEAIIDQYIDITFDEHFNALDHLTRVGFYDDNGHLLPGRSSLPQLADVLNDNLWQVNHSGTCGGDPYPGLRWQDLFARVVLYCQGSSIASGKWVPVQVPDPRDRYQ